MGELGTITFYGESGKRYLFHTYDKYTEFKDVSAVYIFTKMYRNSYGEYSQKPLYIGQSSELGTRIASHEKWECVNNHGCTHINVMAITGDQARLDAETDLIHKYNPICNLQ